jgi:LacI family transcriptional regulator
MARKRKILVALRLEYSSHRAFLTGIARYRKRMSAWDVTVVEGFTDFTAAALRDTLDAGYEGILTVVPRTREAEQLLAECPIPIAVLGMADDLAARTAPTVYVKGREEEVGATAARYFMSLGSFRSFAFVGIASRISWSKARRIGFRKELRKLGRHMTTISSPFPDGSADDLKFLEKALLRLPKPAAVMATHDNRALNVLSVCSQPELTVPSKVSVIGVDNDPVLCDFSSPTLTSISMDQDRKGEVAAEELEKLINTRSRQIHTIILKNVSVVRRESTAPIAPAAYLIERALRFIADNACSGIRARDVIAHLGVSPELVYRRFRENGLLSLAGEINRVRLEAVKRQLRETRLPIAVITDMCGFPSAKYAKRLFKQTFGLTMREFRVAKEVTTENSQCRQRHKSGRGGSPSRPNSRASP